MIMKNERVITNEINSINNTLDLEKKNNCLACKNEKIISRDTIVTGFLSERIFGITDGSLIPVKIYYCTNCGFTSYDRRLSENEEKKLYSGYRSEEYQLMRQKYEENYTKDFNYLLGHDEKGLQAKESLLSEILIKHIHNHIYNGLDYGGDLGQRYPKNFPIDNKYVYDISGVKPLEGIISLASYDMAKTIDFDFIMCNHTLEHIADLDSFVELVKGLGNTNTWFYFEVPFDSPFYPWSPEKRIRNRLTLQLQRMKRYLYLRLEKVGTIYAKRTRYFCQMHEHVNFFTPYALKEFLERHDFKIYFNEVNITDGNLGKGRLISILCKLNQ